MGTTRKKHIVQGRRFQRSKETTSHAWGAYFHFMCTTNKNRNFGTTPLLFPH